MILQALCDYYDRKQDDLPPFGFEEKAIPFIIIINEMDNLFSLKITAKLKMVRQLLGLSEYQNQ